MTLGNLNDLAQSVADEQDMGEPVVFVRNSSHSALAMYLCNENFTNELLSSLEINDVKYSAEDTDDGYTEVEVEVEDE